MPRYDGTGPTGSGPRTGRVLGPCARGVGLIGRPIVQIGQRLFGRRPRVQQRPRILQRPRSGCRRFW